jgi:hypothetical protein
MCLGDHFETESVKCTEAQKILLRIRYKTIDVTFHTKRISLKLVKSTAAPKFQGQN